MSRDAHVGILGLGLFLPPEIRRNDWWSPEVVASWIAKRPAPAPARETLTEGSRKVVAAMSEQARDPFQGAVARRVMADDMSLLDMEERASRSAIARSGIDPALIDLVLTNTIVPDHLLGNPACALHQRLELSKTCFSMHVDVATYSFMMQLTLAEAMIRAGRARAALLVQSCATSRLIEPTDPTSPLFGDIATAAVVGPVSDEWGIAASVHFTDGRFPKTLIASVPGARWFDEGRVRLHVGDPAQLQQVFLGTADVIKESVDAVLVKSGRTANEVAVFSIHQGTPWLRKVVQNHVGLAHARSVETFRDTGYVFASTIPAALAAAVDQGVLAAGDVVVLAGGGPGQTYGATLMTWAQA